MKRLGLAVAMLVTLAGCESLSMRGMTAKEIKATGVDKDATAVCEDFQGPGWANRIRYLSVNKAVLAGAGTVKVTQDCGIEFQDGGKPPTILGVKP